VTASDSAGSRSASVAVNVDNHNSANVPSTPGNAKAALVLSDLVVATWNASTGKSPIVGYHIFRGGKLRATTTQLYYADPTVVAGSSYTYGIEAYDAAGNVSPWAVVKVTTPGTVVSPPPSVSVPPMVITPAGAPPVTLPGGVVATVGGTVSLVPSGTATGSAVSVNVDGGTAASNGQLDTTYLTNGQHTVTVSATTAGGQTSSATETMNVSNKLNPLETTRDELFAAFHGNRSETNTAVAVVLGLLVLIAAGLIAWFWGRMGRPNGGRRPTKARATLR